MIALFSLDDEEMKKLQDRRLVLAGAISSEREQLRRPCTRRGTGERVQANLRRYSTVGGAWLLLHVEHGVGSQSLR